MAYTIEVAPLVGAWIEIVIRRRSGLIRKQSLPSRERGLKLCKAESDADAPESLSS